MAPKRVKGYQSTIPNFKVILKRHRAMRKLQRDLGELNLSKSKLRRALIQLTTKSYVVLKRWSKDIVPGTDDENKCGKSLPILDDSLHEENHINDKEDLSDAGNTKQILKCTNKENRKVHADTTSQITSKLHRHGVKNHVSDSQMGKQKTKFKPKINERKKCLIDKCKVKREDNESTNKVLNASNSKKVLTNNISDIIPSSNNNNKIQIPVQINREKIRTTVKVRLCAKEVNNKKSSCYTPETMEADSTVSNHKKEHVLQDDLCQSGTADKFQDNSNIPKTLNQSFLTLQKRKRIKEKFRNIFDECLTLSEEEEEECIIDSRLYKRRKKDSSGSWSDSTSIESHTVLDMTLSQIKAQATISNLVVCEEISNNTVYTETYENENIQQQEAVSSITNVIECNNNEAACDSDDMFVLQTTSHVGENVYTKEVATKAPLLDNDKQIQANCANEVQINAVYYSSKNCSLNSVNNTEKKCAEEPSKFKKLTDTEKDALPDSNINTDNCNDTTMKVLTNYAIKIRTSSEKSNSNNNFGEITCHVSQNSYIKKMEQNADSSDSDVATEALNSALDSTFPVKENLGISKDGENHLKAPQDDTSINMAKKRESAMVTNINVTESHTKNINDCSVEIQIKVTPYTETSESTLKISDVSQQNINDSTSKVCKQRTNVGEDLNQLLQMDINENHKIQSTGNTISIQEDLRKDRNQYATVQNFCTSNILNHGNEINKETLTEKDFIAPTDMTLKENANTCNTQNKDDAVISILSDEAVQLMISTGDNISHSISDTSKQHTLLDCNDKNIGNFKQPETIQINKIRVLSSAELGSRWCPTPVNNLAPEPLIEAKLPCHTIPVPINDIESSKDSTTEPTLSTTNSSTGDTNLNMNTSSHCIKCYLWCICKRIIHLRNIEKQYSSNNCQDMNARNQKTMSNDLLFKSNFLIFLEEMIYLGKELKENDMEKVVEYMVFTINKYYIGRSEPVSTEEIARYVKAFRPVSSEVLKSTSSSDISTSNEQNRISDCINIAPSKPAPTVSNSANAVPVTLAFIPNLYLPIVPQVQTTYNNLPNQNIHTSNVLNQSHEYNICNIQGTQKSSTSISYIPSMQPTYTNAQVLQENSTSSLYMPYGQHIIQQQPIMQSRSNIHTAQRMNVHQNSQEGFIRNKSELLIGQSSMPQRLPQQTIPNNILLQRQIRPQGSQIHMAQNVQNSRIPYSTTTPTQFVYSTHSQNLPPKTNTLSQNLPPGTNIIPHELLLKIWDQIACCLEKKIFDCSLHERYDKVPCCLKTFHKAWKPAVSIIILHKIKSQHGEFHSILQSEEAKYIYNNIKLRREVERCKHQQLLLENKELQKKSELKKALNKKKKCKQLESPVNIESKDIAVQPEVAQNKTQKDTNNEQQQQSQVPSDSKLLEHIVVSPSNTASTAPEKSNSLFVESNHVNVDNTKVLSHKPNNIKNLADITTPENRIEKQENMLKSNGLSSPENDEIEILKVVHNKEKNSLFEQTITEEMKHVKEGSLLPKKTVREEVVIDGSSLTEHTIREDVLHVKERDSLPDQTITEKIVKEGSSLLEQMIKYQQVHAKDGNSLSDQTIREEVLHVTQGSSLPDQTIRETVIHVREGNLIPEQIVTKDVVHGKEGGSLSDQIIREKVVQEKEESSLAEQTMREFVHGKETSSLLKLAIRDNPNYLQCDLIQSVTSLEPHIIDVRSISPMSFNKMEEISPQNDLQSFPIKNNTSNEVTVRIEIPEDIICLQCSKTSTVVCEVCLEAHYCSKECSELHWVLEHYKYCKPYSLTLSEKCANDVSTTEDINFDVNDRSVL